MAPFGETFLKSFKGCSVNVKFLALLQAHLLPFHLCSSPLPLPSGRQDGTVSHVIDMMDRSDQEMRGCSCTLLNPRAKDLPIFIRTLAHDSSCWNRKERESQQLVVEAGKKGKALAIQQGCREERDVPTAAGSQYFTYVPLKRGSMDSLCEEFEKPTM